MSSGRHSFAVVIAAFNLFLGLFGMVGGLMFASLAALSVHTERDQIPGYALLLASGMLALSAILWLMALNFPRASLVWLAAAITHVMAVFAGIVYILLMYGYVKADIFREEGVVVFLFTIPAGLAFLISAVELPFFLLLTSPGKSGNCRDETANTAGNARVDIRDLPIPD